MSYDHPVWASHIIPALLLLFSVYFWRQSRRLSSEASRTVEQHLDVVRSTYVKLDAALSANENFQASREEAWALYRRSAITAGNAQAWLFRELQNSYGLLNRYRQEKGEAPLQVPADLESAIVQFRKDHVEGAKS